MRLTIYDRKKAVSLAKSVKEKDIDFSDIPELDAEWIKNVARPGRPKKNPADLTEAMTIRVPKKLLAHLREKGRGWQSKVVEAIETLVKKGAL